MVINARFAIRGGRLRRADFPRIAQLNKRLVTLMHVNQSMDGAGVTRLDQTLSAELHRRSPANRPTPRAATLIDHLREVAQGRDDIRTECAGVIAGSWFADAARRGEELVAVGLLMLAGHVDLDELDRWVRVGWERRGGASNPYPDGEG